MLKVLREITAHLPKSVVKKRSRKNVLATVYTTADSRFPSFFNHKIGTILRQNKTKRGGQALTASREAQELESKMNRKDALFWEVQQNTKPLLSSVLLLYTMSVKQRETSLHPLPAWTISYAQRPGTQAELTHLQPSSSPSQNRRVAVSRYTLTYRAAKGASDFKNICMAYFSTAEFPFIKTASYFLWLTTRIIKCSEQ